MIAAGGTRVFRGYNLKIRSRLTSIISQFNNVKKTNNLSRYGGLWSRKDWPFSECEVKFWA